MAFWCPSLPRRMGRRRKTSPHLKRTGRGKPRGCEKPFQAAWICNLEEKPQGEMFLRVFEDWGGPWAVNWELLIPEMTLREKDPPA